MAPPAPRAGRHLDPCSRRILGASLPHVDHAPEASACQHFRYQSNVETGEFFWISTAVFLFETGIPRRGAGSGAIYLVYGH
jgi:hypothetical protein